ncbi:hypothetical protein ACTJKC_19670 [Pedobacter sp. 22226]|uniref:hypothetical protein n=1 Tax=Pedobacter sp. 22226 TaxID=3453894 RepID=UPI003F829C22
MNTKLYLVVLMLILGDALMAQNITKQEKGYFNLTEFGYHIVNHIYEAKVEPNRYVGATSGSYALSLRNINGVFLTNNISIGAGIGLENYTDNNNYYLSNNLFQLFLDVRYYFKNQNKTFFAYGNAGTGLKVDNNFRKGAMFNLGSGYKFKVGPKAGILVSLGYSDQTIRINPSMTKKRYYGIAAKVGLLL